MSDYPEETLHFLIFLAEYGTIDSFVPLFDTLKKKGVNVTHCNVLKAAFSSPNIPVIDFLVEGRRSSKHCWLCDNRILLFLLN